MHFVLAGAFTGHEASFLDAVSFSNKAWKLQFPESLWLVDLGTIIWPAADGRGLFCHHCLLALVVVRSQKAPTWQVPTTEGDVRKRKLASSLSASLQFSLGSAFTSCTSSGG